MKFSDEEYEEHKTFLSDLKDSINMHSRQKSTDNLANPSSLSCKYCDYTSLCKPLHNKLIYEASEFNTIVLIDQINSEFDDQNSKINITTNGGIRSVHKIPRDHFITIKNEINKNNKILLTKLYDIQSTNIKNWTRFTCYDII